MANLVGICLQRCGVLLTAANVLSVSVRRTKTSFKYYAVETLNSGVQFRRKKIAMT